MVDDQKIVGLCQVFDGRVRKFLQGTLLPFNRYARVQLAETLGDCGDAGVAAAVGPGDSF